MHRISFVLALLCAAAGGACPVAEGQPPEQRECAGPLDDRFDTLAPTAWLFERWCLNNPAQGDPPTPEGSELLITTNDYCLDQVTSTVALPEGRVRVVVTPHLTSGGDNQDILRVALAADGDSLSISGGGGVQFRNGSEVWAIAPGLEQPITAFVPGDPVTVTLEIADGVVSGALDDGDAVELARVATAPFLILAVGNSTDGASIDDVSSSQPCPDP